MRVSTMLLRRLKALMEDGMSRLRFLVLVLCFGCATAFAQSRADNGATTPPTVPLDKNKLSYAIGYQIGSQFTGSNSPDVDIAVLVRALQDAYAKRPPGVSMQQMHDQLVSFDTKMHEDALAQYKRIAAANLLKSAQFMDRNKAQPGVIALPSGIQYAVLHNGEGKAHPTVSSTVTVNYRGALIDGTEFDSSWAHGKPVTFTVNRVIRGWQDVVPRMRVGDKWKVIIPPQLAYGERGELPRIGPNEALVFEIELLEIKP
jgi:FKBP-type peptidyl-prolyl cis-trans isomerase FklB